jgi:hypothetical protein
MQIPIVSASEIIGWTEEIPEFFGSALRHAEAERLVGGEVRCVYVEIEDRAAARRAGAPPEWDGAWRCLALCSDRTIRRARAGDLMPVISIGPRQRPRAEGAAGL